MSSDTTTIAELHAIIQLAFGWRDDYLTGGVADLVAAVEAGRFDELDTIADKQRGSNRNALRVKPLALYFPDAFLPIASEYNGSRNSDTRPGNRKGA